MLIRLNYTRPQPKDIQEIVDCLKNDGIIIYPTDTVYSALIILVHFDLPLK